MSQELQRHLGISIGLAILRAPVVSCWLTALKQDEKILNAGGGAGGHLKTTLGLALWIRIKKAYDLGVCFWCVRFYHQKPNTCTFSLRKCKNPNAFKAYRCLIQW